MSVFLNTSHSGTGQILTKLAGSHLVIKFHLE